MTSRARRVRSCLLGAALGEAMSWPSLFTRAYQLPPWPRRILREMADFHERERVSRLPLPFSLNQPAEAFDLCPVAGTEWMMLTASMIIEASGAYQQEKVLSRWQDLANEREVLRGSVGAMTALDNLGERLLPPVSGHDNPHYFDDSAMIRAIPIGACYAGRPEAAETAAAFDASITNAEDGILGAVAVARGIALACGGASQAEVIRAMVDSLPSASWIGETVRRHLAAVHVERNPLSVVPALHDMVNREYSFGGIAGETLAVALAALSAGRGELPAALLIASSVPKSAESAPMLVGAVAGSLNADAIPAEWIPSLSRLRGVAIPSFRGMDLVRLVEEFASMTEAGTTP